MKKKYKNKFYSNRDSATRYSANTIIDLLFEIYEPKSVIDLGCGVGTWLDVCKKHGADDILGLEGEWLKKEKLVINESEFFQVDLGKELQIEKKFDLAISLEVAEHIREENVNTYINNLIKVSDVILFSAAIPNQGGVNHFNEQWQSYWVEKFENKGYAVFDFIRPRIWDDSKIKMWYRQNIFLFVNKENSIIEKLQCIKKKQIIEIVHPEMFLRKLELRHPSHLSFQEALKYFPLITYRSLHRSLHKKFNDFKKMWDD